MDEEADGPKLDIPHPAACIPGNRTPGAQAMKVTPTTRVAVTSWLEGCSRIARTGVVFWSSKSSNKVHTAHDGEWVVRTYTGHIFVLPDPIFHTIYDMRRSKKR